MNSLKVPDSGWELEGSGKSPDLPLQVFSLNLSDTVIEDMIKCVSNGDKLQLSLGDAPTFLYGSSSHVITPSNDEYPFDIYLTQPFETIKRAEKIPYAGSLFETPKGPAPAKPSAAKTTKEAEPKSKGARASKSSTPSALDSDREALQSEMAALAAGRGKARVVDKLPGTKKGAAKAKGKLLQSYASSTPRSIPASPGQFSQGSPTSTPALSASQQHVERAKEQRVVLVHELAVQDRSLEYINKKWTGREEDLRPTLEKVADNLPDTKKWSMKKTYWKELDVWNYDYDTQEVRQKAIDNAVRQYDKQRLSSGEPEWQRLLPKEERGKGKCLSRLQANLAKGPPPPAPKIKVQKADGSPVSRESVSSPDGDRSKVGGEPMSRTASNPLPTKKKLGGPEVPIKRLLGTKSKSSASTPKAPSRGVTKTSPTKSRAVSKSKDGRVLSKEIIENSDSSDDEPSVIVKTRPVAKKIKEPMAAKPRPVAKEPIKRVQPAKRPRDDDDSSSSSATPLAKRIKPKQPLPVQKPKHRPSDASQNSRGTGTTSSSLKSKNTSPTKSSPLASSPPTNASDLEHEARPAIQVAKKRKMEAVSRPAKRQAVVSVSDELVLKARRFKTFYEKYEALHYKILRLDNPDQDELGSLRDMRDRLAEMKREIYRECPPARA